MLVGYDDSLGTSGAFLVQNSFGTDWPYLNATTPLMQGRLWWTYESFFALQRFGCIAYPLPRRPTIPRTGTVTLDSRHPHAPRARVIEAHRGDHKGESFAVFEVDFAQPVHLNTLRVTPPRAHSPVEGWHRAPIKYGFAHVARGAPFPPGRYAVELDAHLLSESLSRQQPINYQGYITIG